MMESALSFGPTGSTLAYTAKVEGRSRFVLDGEVQLGYEAVPWRDPHFSPDASHVAFIARVPGGEAVILDGTAGPTFRRILDSNFQVAPNGRLSYVAMWRKRFRRRYLFVVDGNVMAESGSGFYSSGLSPDGRRFCYSDYASHRSFVEGDLLPEGTERMEFAPDGRLYTQVGDQAFLDGVPLGVAPSSPSERVTRKPVFTRDGQHFAWPAKVGQKYVLMHDGVRSSEEMDFIGTTVFSSDGTRLAFDARVGGQWCVIVDGCQGPWFDDIFALHFSPDGCHLAYWAKGSGKSFLVFDQSPGPPIDELRQPASMWPDPGVFEFSPDGHHVAAVAILGAKMKPLVDTELGPELEKSGQPVFHDEDAVSFFGLRGKNVYLVRATLD